MSNEVRFTKGEWLVTVNDDFMDSENLVVSMASHTKDRNSFMSKHKVVFEGSGSGDPEAIANAHLFSQSKAMYEMLESVSRELHMLIDEVNDQRASHIHPQTETPPDYHDMQTLHEIQVLLAKARGINTEGN